MNRKDWYEQLKDDGDIIDRGTYLSIPYEVLAEVDIGSTEKIILAMIISFTDKHMECHMSNEYLCDKLGVSHTTPSYAIKRLITLGYIKGYYKFKPYSRSLKGRVLEPAGKYFKHKIKRESGYIYKLIEYGKDKEDTKE